VDQDIVKLFQNYIENNCSSAEVQQVLSFIKAGTFQEEWDYVLEQDAQKLLNTKDAVPIRNELSRIYLHHRLLNSVNALENNSTAKSFRLNWKTVSITAAASLLLFIGWWFFTQKESQLPAEDDQLANQTNILPGKPGAKLRRANGQLITLDGAKGGIVVKNEQLSYNDGTSLKSSDQALSDDSYTALTDYGNMYKLTLSDGTMVWLNAASQLDFPAHFTGTNRQVKLKGEAFFKVAKDKTHPFIVESKGQQVKVLGTEFNINSYTDEQFTKTTLVSGSIQITGTGNNFLLKPGQQARLDAEGTLTVAQIDTTLALAWKNDKFLFEDNDIQSVMRMVQRWYNVEVIYSGPRPDVTFGGKISRYNSVSSVLHVLETTGGVHFKTRGNKIYVFK
jgi:transmembrane sensor